MTLDLKVSLAPGPGRRVRLRLEILNPPATSGQVFSLKTPRKLIKWEPETAVDELMRGELTGPEGADFVAKVTKQVSEWLLDPDLGPYLTLTLQNVAEHQARLIFATDERLDDIMNFSEVPIELVTPEGGTAYALDHRFAAVVHLLGSRRESETPASSLYWPLRVLVFRANPKDRDLVPEAAPISEHIRTLGASLGVGAVQVDVVSSEPAVGVRASVEEFRTRLGASLDPYDVLVFLGHGNVVDEFGRRRPSLRFEAGDGRGGQDVPAKDLADILQEHPVPVVLLVSCLSADKVASLSDDERQELRRDVIEWMRGNQGVAQALIANDAARVQVVLGMRYRLESSDADRFLRAFFDSLLKLKPGHVEAAVRRARGELNQSTFPAAYSAPVMFRAYGGTAEPLFPFLGSKMPGCMVPRGSWHLRELFWDDLQRLPLDVRQAVDASTALEFLKQTERALIAEATDQPGTSLVLPEVAPEAVLQRPGATVSVPIRLYGEIPVPKLERLEGRLTVNRAPGSLKTAIVSPEMAAAGYELWSQIEGADLIFTLKAKDGADLGRLNDVRLFDVELALGPGTDERYEIAVHGIESTPAASVCPGMSAVIVPVQ